MGSPPSQSQSYQEMNRTGAMGGTIGQISNNGDFVSPGLGNQIPNGFGTGTQQENMALFEAID